MRVATPEAAELCTSIFRSVNSALVNELAMLCDRMEIDVWEVVDAASPKRCGFMGFEPGPGMSGHCRPADPLCRSRRASAFDMATDLVELAGKVIRASITTRRSRACRWPSTCAA